MKDVQNETSGRYAVNPQTARGHDDWMALVFRVVVPALLMPLAALATRFWWAIPFTDRPSWLEEDSRFAADAGWGAAAATEAGSAAMMRGGAMPVGEGFEDGLAGAFGWLSGGAFTKKSRPGPVAEATGDAPSLEAAPAGPRLRLPSALPSQMTATRPPPSHGGAQEDSPDTEYLVCEEWIGPNWQLLSVVGLLVAIGCTTSNIRIGAGFAAFWYLASMSYGYLAWRAGARKVQLYWQEVLLATMFIVLFGISYAVPQPNYGPMMPHPPPSPPHPPNPPQPFPLHPPPPSPFPPPPPPLPPSPPWQAPFYDPQPGVNSPAALTVQQYFPFIIHSPLAAGALFSVLAQRPFTLQWVLETVVEAGWTKKELLPGSYYTSIAWFMAHTLSIFSYLVRAEGGSHLGAPHSFFLRLTTTAECQPGPPFACLPNRSPPLVVSPPLQIAFQTELYGKVDGQYQRSGSDNVDNGFTMVLVIVVPILLVTTAALFTRFW
jgi:hypothetical protein